MGKLTAWVAVHRKLIAVVTGTALTVAVQIWGTSNPYVSLAILAATSLGVYRLPNAASPAAETRQAVVLGTQNPTSGTVRIVSNPGAGTSGPAPSGAPQ